MEYPFYVVELVEICRVMKGCMYILECYDGSFYTGSTQNIETRLVQHQNGEGANFTASRLPVKLVYQEEYERIDEAFSREKQIQGWSRAKKLALIQGKFDQLPIQAECKNSSHSSKQENDALSSDTRNSSLSGVETNGI